MTMRTAVFCVVLLQLTFVASHEIFRRASNLTFEQVEAILNNLTARVTVLELLGSNCLEKIAAAVDFGNSPFGEVYVGLNQLVKFNRVKLNLGGGYNISTGIFTAPGNGIYECGFQLMSSNLRPSTEYGIMVNSTTLVASTHASGYSTVNDKSFAVAVVQLKLGDTVSVMHRYGAAYLWGSPLTAFFCLRVLC